MTPDPIHQQRQRELLITLCRAYGIVKNLDGLDNRELKSLLEQEFWGSAKQ